MAIKYVDFSGSAGTGDGSSFANRAAKLDDIGYLYAQNDEIRIKGNPITSLGTCKTGPANRHNARAYGSSTCSYSNIVYSTTTGETYIKEAGLGEGGWQTGDRIFIIEDTKFSAENQPSIAGIWEVTVTDSYDVTNGKVKLNGYTANSNATNSSSGSFNYVVHNSDVVKLNTSNIFKDIACTDPERSTWTSAGTATTSNAYSDSAWQSSGVENIYAHGADKIEVPSSQAVGKIAHYQLPSALDLSGYQQISFMVRSDAEDFTTPDEIRLCTDTAGNTSVHTAPIQLRKSYDQCWVASVTDLGTNMNSSIQSVALYRAATQSAACVYRLQNIVACKDSSSADSVTHKSCVGLDDGIWYNVAWMHRDFICVKCMDNYRGNKWTYYYGGANAKWKTTGDTVNLYKTEPFYPSFAEVTSDTTSLDEVNNFNNNSGQSWLLVSGGWNNTDMSTKSGATIVHGNNRGRYLSINSRNYLHLKDFSIHGFHNSVHMYYCDHMKMENMGFAYDADSDASVLYECQNLRMLKLAYVIGLKELEFDNTCQDENATKSDFSIEYCCGHTNTYGLDFDAVDVSSLPSGATRNLIFSKIDISPNGYTPRIEAYGWDLIDVDTFNNRDCYFSGQSGIYSDQSATLKIGTFNFQNSGYMYPYFKKIDITTFNGDRPVHPTTPNSATGKMMGVDAFTTQYYTYYSGQDTYINAGTLGGKIKCQKGSQQKWNNIAIPSYGDIIEAVDGASLIQFKDYDQTASDNRAYGGAHTFSPNTSVRNTGSGFSIKAEVRSTSSAPADLQLGSILVNSGSVVTVSLYVYITGSETITLKIPAKGYMGISSDQTVTSQGVSQSTWTQITKTFTPTATGKLDVLVAFTNNSTSSVMYIDDFGVSQA